MLMSFLGSIGSIMSGSGLAELLETIYGRKTVMHMITGKAVARALRGHYLTEAALLEKIITELVGEDSTVNQLTSDRMETGDEEEDLSVLHIDEVVTEGGHADAEQRNSTGSERLRKERGQNTPYTLQPDDVRKIAETFVEVLDGTISLSNAIECESYVRLLEAIEHRKDYLSSKSRTSEL